MELALYIHELILHNECIILPGFGGFETEYIPASYDSVKGIMLPPSKSISFKTEYQTGGGILEKHLSKKLGIKQEQAHTIIENYVSDIRLKLANGENVSIDGVGTFTSGISGTIYFSPLKEENYLADSFGLEPLPVAPIKKQPVKAEKKEPALKIAGRSNTLAFVIVGVIVVSILLTITIILSSKFNLYLFNIGDKNSKSEMIVIGGSADLTDSTLTRINNKIDDYTSVKKALSYTQESTYSNTSEPIKHYLLIDENYSTVKSAFETEKKLKSKGISSSIIKIGNNYKVCLGKFANKEKASEELERLKNLSTEPLVIFSVDGE